MLFRSPDILEQLVKLVTLEPEENVEDKVKFKSVKISMSVYAHVLVHISCTIESTP